MRPTRSLALTGLIFATSLVVVGCATSGVKMASGGGGHSCAALFDGRVLCWGDNNAGQLGTGNLAPSLTPVGVPPYAFAANDPPVLGLAAGDSHTCVLGRSGKIFCTGSNQYGQLGVNSRTDYISLQPVRATIALADGSARPAKGIAAGRRHTCAVYDNGLVACWGFGSPPEPTIVPESHVVVGTSAPLAAQLISARYDQTCVIRTDARVACWDVVGNTAPAPMVVSGILAQGALAAGKSHACATDQSGAIQCWGWNTFAQLGNGSRGGSTNTPSRVVTQSSSRVLDLAAGDNHTCALFNDGSVECWGANDAGQTGDPGPAYTLNSRQVIASDAVAIAAGAMHSCAAIVQNKVRRLKCWGLNGSGQLGDGTKNSATAPVLVQSLP